MIAYIRGRLDTTADADEVAIRTDTGLVGARLYAPPGSLSPGDEVIAAAATVPIGVDDHALTAMLGPWPANRPDPAGPLGLASAPVILLPVPSLETVAAAGADRAGREPAIALLSASTAQLGLELLAATSSGAEVVVLSEATGRHVDLVRIVGGRAVVALAFPDAAAATAWLGDAELDADLPVPTGDDGWLRDVATLGLESMHQLVQVDPTIAIDPTRTASGKSAAGAAAAAGMLAGRIAAGTRRWRAALEQ
jgi:hypothetical protein